MKLYHYPRNGQGEICFVAFFFFMLILARDTLITSVLLGFYLSQILMIILIVVVGLAFLRYNRGRMNEILTDPRMRWVIISTVVILLPMLLKGDMQMMYFSILLCLYFAIFLSYFMSMRRIARYYVLVMTALAVYSVICLFVLKPLTEAGLLPTFVVYNSAGAPFYVYGLCFTFAQQNYVRNFGIFREPGVYQFFILLALYLNNYTAQWKSQKRVWIINAILAVTMLTTFSTNGVIELALFVVFLFFDKKMYKKKAPVIIACGLAAAAIVMLIVICVQKGALYWTLYGMINKLFNLTASSGSRLEAVFVDLEFFLSSPLYGGKIGEIMYAVEHNTTSTMLMFAIFGIFGGALSVVSWGVLIWDKKRHIIGNLFLLVIMLMSFNTQNLIADVFFWLFPMMATAERGTNYTGSSGRRRVGKFERVRKRKTGDK